MTLYNCTLLSKITLMYIKIEINQYDFRAKKRK